METIPRVNLSAPFRGIGAETPREVIKVCRSAARVSSSALRHWLSGAARLKVCRFNFYSRQCVIPVIRPDDSTDSPTSPIHFRRSFEKRYPGIPIVLIPPLLPSAPPSSCRRNRPRCIRSLRSSLRLFIYEIVAEDLLFISGSRLLF